MPAPARSHHKLSKANMEVCFKYIFLLLIFSTKPQNASSVTNKFYGSSESRFLTSKASILDAFTRFRDYVLISGDITSIESLLATSDRTGTLIHLLSWVWDFFCLSVDNIQYINLKSLQNGEFRVSP